MKTAPFVVGTSGAVGRQDDGYRLACLKPPRPSEGLLLAAGLADLRDELLTFATTF